MNGSICVFGDSIVWGAYDSEKGGWVNRLALSLIDEDIEVYNLGISGENTNGLLKRINIECKAREPEVIIFAIGVNDSQQTISENKNLVEIKRFQNNLLGLIKIARKFTDKIFFLGLTRIEEQKLTPIPWHLEGAYYEKDVKLYDSKIKELCSKNGIDYIDLFNLLDKKDLYDGIHPNSKGHEKICKKVKEFLIEKSYLK